MVKMPFYSAKGTSRVGMTGSGSVSTAVFSVFSTQIDVDAIAGGGGDVGCQGLGSLVDGHGLQVDLAGAGDDGVEEALAAEEHILCTPDGLDVHGAAFAHGCKIPGVHDDALTGTQFILLAVAVHFHEQKAIAADPLHDEALTAHQAGAQLLLEIHRQVQALFHGQEAGLLDDKALAGSDLKGNDGAGEAGSKGDHAVAALRGILRQEQGFSGEQTAEHLLKPPAAGGFHAHIGAHPAHSAALGAQGLTHLGIADDYRQIAAFNAVL